MAWVDYTRQDDGRLRLVDDQGGELLAVPTPSVQQMTAEIDARKANALATPAPMPDPIITAQNAPQSMQLDQVGPPVTPAVPAAGSGGGGNPFAPPAPLVNVAPPTGANPFAPAAPLVNVAPSVGGSALAPMAPAAPDPAATPAAAPPAPAAQPAPVGPIVRAGGAAQGPTPGSVAAGLYFRAAEEEAKGSPGMVVPGGTFPTGHTVQFAPGPDPAATRARELAEKQLGNVRSDLAYVEARKQQELGELATGEAQRAAERQRQMQDIQAREREKLGGLLDELDTKRRDLADAKVDPDRLINGMSTGRQAILAIGMALGGFGKALAGEDGPSQAMQTWKEAVANDIENQKYAIEKKRGDLNELGKVYAMAKERFGDERMALDATYLAGLDIYKAKIARTVAEADAAMGVETQYDENGQIIASSPYSMKAKEAFAAIAVEQARIRESLSQQSAGQVAQQYVTTQTRVVGGKRPNLKAAAELVEKGEKALGESGEQQQVNYNNQQYKLGKFVSPSEGADVRKKLNLVGTLQQQIARAQRLRNSLVGVDPLKNKEYVDIVNGIAGMRSVLIDQGVLQGNEREEFQDLSKSILSGSDVLNNIGAMADRIAGGYLDQLDAKPIGQGSKVAVPQGLQDAADGKKLPAGGGGGGGGGAAAPSKAPPSPVVRASGARALPLDRAGAATLQASTADGDKARGKAVALVRQHLRESLAAKQLGPSEYKVALQMANDEQFDELLDFLGRMRGATGPVPALTPEEQAALGRSLAASTAIQRAGLADFQTQAGADRALGVGTTVTTKVSTKGPPAVKAGKFVNLQGKKKLWPAPHRRRSPSTAPTTSPSRWPPTRPRRCCGRGSTVCRKMRPCRCRRRTAPGRPSAVLRRCSVRSCTPPSSVARPTCGAPRRKRSSAAPAPRPWPSARASSTRSRWATATRRW